MISAMRLEWMRDVLRVAVSTGMRQGETLGLALANVNLKDATAWGRTENAKCANNVTVTA